MKKLRYKYVAEDGTLCEAEADYSPLNEELVKAEALNGVYSIEDDGQEEPKTPEQEIAELKAALNRLLEGLTQ